MRVIDTHKTNPANERLTVAALDEPGQGGANHLYEIRGFSTASNPSCPFVARYGQPADHATVLFQNGPIKEVGVNGVTHEVLLAILIDRLEGHQRSQYACRENAIALTKLQEALHWLHHRTRNRESRGVEGTHTP